LATDLSRQTRIFFKKSIILLILNPAAIFRNLVEKMLQKAYIYKREVINGKRKDY